MLLEKICQLFRSGLAQLFKMLPFKEGEAGQSRPSRCQHDIAIEPIQQKIQAAVSKSFVFLNQWLIYMFKLRLNLLAQNAPPRPIAAKRCAPGVTTKKGGVVVIGKPAAVTFVDKLD